MKHTMKKTLQVATFLCATALSTNAMAQANVATVSNTMTVQNSVTVAIDATNDQLNFGVIALQSGTDGVAGSPTDEDMGATATVNSAGVVSAAANATGTDSDDVQAIAQVVDNTLAEQAIINISDAVDGSTLNVTIDNVTNPINGFSVLTLDGFRTSFNGGGEATTNLTAGSLTLTPTYSASFGGGTNTLAIGATIAADEGVTVTDSVTYTGSFDVTVSY
ncbi:MAG: hypothetical protein ACRBCT_02350 [Alphaproteobacteria bacterium]